MPRGLFCFSYSATKTWSSAFSSNDELRVADLAVHENAASLGIGIMKQMFRDRFPAFPHKHRPSTLYYQLDPSFDKTEQLTSLPSSLALTVAKLGKRTFIDGHSFALGLPTKSLAALPFMNL
jgi:hypothetical protein